MAALAMGGAASIAAAIQGAVDINTLLNNPALTDAVKSRLKSVLLRNIVAPGLSGLEIAELYSAEAAPSVADQTAALAKATPGAAPANDPTGGLDAPPSPSVEPPAE